MNSTSNTVRRRRRRHTLLSIGIATVVAITGTACTPQESTDPVAQVISVGVPTPPTSLDPNVASSADDGMIIRQVFDSLIVETLDHQFKPWLAEDWTISDDGLAYTFTLREGVTFHDGTPFNAEAVKFNIERILNPDTKSRYAISLLGPVESAEVVDEHTVTLHLTRRYMPLLEALSQPFLGMLSPAAVEKYGEDVAFNPVGTGPFVFDKYVADQEVVLTANPDYNWAASTESASGAPAIETISFKVVAETSARVGALSTGELTVAKNIPAEQLDIIEANPELENHIVQVPGSAYALYPNQLNAPWDNVEARKALRMSVDVDSILQTLFFGHYPRAWSILSPATDGYAASTENAWSYDPAQAVAIFESLGYTKNDQGMLAKNGEVLTVRVVNQSPNRDKRHEIDEIMQQQLKQVGIDLVTSALEFPQYAAATQGGEYELSPFSITTGSPSVLYTIFNPANQPDAEKLAYNVAHYVDADMDNWGKAAAEAATADEANGYYRQMQEKATDEAVAIPIYVQVITIASRADLKGLTFDPRAYPLFYGASF